MKKRLPILLGLLALVLAGCQDTPVDPGTNPGGGDTPGTGDQQQGPTVESVSLAMQDGSSIPTEVFDGSSLRLTASVKGSEQGLKVNWETSDKTLATVTNGVVKFGKVSEDTQVTISAVSKDDSSKKATATFTIKHCLIDLANSRGNNLDTSLFMEEGSVVAEAGDVALKFADVHHSKFYVEATVTIDSQLETDDYPKFGIMIGSDEATSWNTTTSDLVVKNAFFFGDQQRAQQSSGWSSFSFVPQNVEHTDWNWGGQLGGFNVSSENKWVMGEAYTIGLLRDGVDYYLFAKDGESIKCYKHIVYTDFAADEACYAWIGGWATGVTVNNFKALVGDAADAMYATPSTLSVADEAPIVFTGNTHQIQVSADAINFDLSKVTYASDNEAVATVDANGVVTATATPGVANITVAYGQVTATVVVTVTDDTKIDVKLDGKMDDALWTDAVKENKLVFNRPAGDVLIDVYAAKNSLGVYFYVNYQSLDNWTSRNDWWTGNNIELRINGINGQLKNSKEVEINSGNQTQWWASDIQGGASNFAGHYVSAPKLNESTGMYEIVFELFVSYASMGITRDDRVGFSIGSNDGGSKWYNSANWNTSNFYDSFKISEDGIGQPYYPEAQCGDNHEYNDWKVLSQASCAADGEKARFCKWCNHKESEVLPKGEHSYGTEVSEVITPSTCTVAGEAYTLCLGNCGTTSTIALPLSHTNHSAWDEATQSCSACGLVNHINETKVLDRYNAGGWTDMNTWLPILSNIQGGDFTAVIEFEMEINDPNAGWWRGALPLIYDPTISNPNSSQIGDNGSCYVVRFDWWGWCDQFQSPTSLGVHASGDPAYRNEWTPHFVEDAQHCKIVWTVTRTGDVIRNEFKITPLSGSHTDTTYTYWNILTHHDNSKTISVAMVAEFAKATVTSATITK